MTMKPMKNYYCWLFFFMLLSIEGTAQEQRKLALPRLEQLSSQHVTQVIQDAEGFLWYATKGGGVCRDDGRQMTVTSLSIIWSTLEKPVSSMAQTFFPMI